MVETSSEILFSSGLKLLLQLLLLLPFRLLLAFWAADSLRGGKLFLVRDFVHLDLYVQRFALAAAVKSAHGTGV